MVDRPATEESDGGERGGRCVFTRKRRLTMPGIVLSRCRPRPVLSPAFFPALLNGDGGDRSRGSGSDRAAWAAAMTTAASAAVLQW